MLPQISTENDRLTSKDTIQKFLPVFRDSLLDISDFETIRVVGEGAFAIVYKCKQISTQQLVAVKVLKPHMLTRERDVYDFLLEAHLLYKLQHPSIVKFKGICYGQLAVKNGFESICVVTEYMESGTLKDWIRAQMLRPEREIYSKRTALHWMIQIAEALDYLHSRQFAIIHRDLKPENILLSPSDVNPNEFNAKVVDFGLSVIVAPKSSHNRRLDSVNELESVDSGDLLNSSHNRRLDSVNELESVDSGALPELLKHGNQRIEKSAESLQKALAGASFVIRSDANSLLSSFSRSNSVKHLMTGKTGSLLYMSPEVLRSDMYNEKIDVFSFGTILYETLEGFRIANKLGLNYTMAAVQDFAERVRDGFRLHIPDDWPEDMKTLIQDCWKDDPKERPSMKKVAERLKNMYESGMFLKRKPRSLRVMFRLIFFRKKSA